VDVKGGLKGTGVRGSELNDEKRGGVTSRAESPKKPRKRTKKGGKGGIFTGKVRRLAKKCFDSANEV